MSPLQVFANVRWALWALATRVRLRARGSRLEMSGSPARGGRPPRVTVARPGSLRLYLGEGVRLGRDVVIQMVGDCSIVLDDHVSIDDGARLRGGGGGHLRVGARTEIRGGAILRFTGALTIGADVMISHWVMINMCHEVTIGDRATLAERVTVVDSDHTYDRHHTYHAPVVMAPTVIGDNVLVSAGAVVGRGVTLPPGVIVAAGAVVGRKPWRPATLIAGVPARELRDLAPIEPVAEDRDATTP